MLRKLNRIIAEFNSFPESYGCNVYRCFEVCKKIVKDHEDYDLYYAYIVEGLRL